MISICKFLFFYFNWLISLDHNYNTFYVFVLAASGVVATLFHDGLMNPCEGIF